MGNSSNTASALAPEERARLMRRATYAAVVVAVFLVVLKAFAWVSSGSVSLLASLVDSSLDVLASLLNLVAVHHALAPADREHRFGHGKAEALAGLGQSLFVAGSALFLLVESVRRLADPVAPGAVDTGVLVMLVSIAVTLALVGYQRYVARRTQSPAIAADSLHYRSDLLVNIGVIAALLLSALGWPGFDGLFAAAVAVYILYGARSILQQSLDHLMDRELPDEEREAIKRIVAGHPQVRGLHDLRSRRSGSTRFVQLHLELDDELTLLEAHSIGDEVEAQLRNAFPAAEFIIHADPLSVAAQEPKPRLG